MRYISLILILLAINFNLYTESIDGPANIRNKPQGQVIFSIEDNQFVSASELTNNWYRIMFTAFVKVESIRNNTIINVDSELYSSDFKTKVGIVKAEYNISGYYIESDNSDFIEVMLFGYTFKSNIRLESILEREIERVLSSGNKLDLIEVYERFGFYESEVENYKVWITYDNDDPWGSPDFRMMIYCDKNNNVIGIANKGRKLKLDTVAESNIDRNYRMQYLINLSEAERIKFEKLMTEAFAGRA